MVIRKKKKNFFYDHLFLLLFIVIVIQAKRYRKTYTYPSTVATLAYHQSTKLCIQLDRNTLRAQHKSCFLRPDTGPCRADIIQFYFDPIAVRCYRFFWGGCQGNGNRFDNRKDCMNYCYLNSSMTKPHVPHYCNLAFDFGTCFGHYNRWAWDKVEKTCKRRLYSGCGGNQNNFETLQECTATCLHSPNDTLHRLNLHTTCIPFTVNDMH